MRSVVVLAVLLLATARTHAEKPAPPDPKVLAEKLTDADPFVRDAAAAALVAQGEDALGALSGIELQGRVAPGGLLGYGCKAALARDIRRAVRTAKRLAAAPDSSVAFWMHFEELLALPAAIRSAALRSALGNDEQLVSKTDWKIEEARRRRDDGRRVAIEFCSTWTDNGGARPPSPDPNADSNRRQEEALRKAGPTASPYLLWLLTHESFPHFRAQAGGPRAGRDFVIAMHAVRLLKLKEAVPYLIPWVGGSSGFAHSRALDLLGELTGQDFGAHGPMEDAQARVEAWWRANRTAYSPATGWFLQAALRDLHEVLADVAVGTSEPLGDYVTSGAGPWWTWRAKRLREIAGPDLAFEPPTDVAGALAAVRAAETWVESQFGR